MILLCILLQKCSDPALFKPCCWHQILISTTTEDILLDRLIFSTLGPDWSALRMSYYEPACFMDAQQSTAGK